MISVVIPVFNEEGSLAALHGELARTAQAAGLECEFLFIDDGSTDGSWNLIRSLADQHPEVHGIRASWPSSTKASTS
jgi:glycosyltransferase involved in cell wall biosynthesis